MHTQPIADELVGYTHRQIHQLYPDIWVWNSLTLVGCSFSGLFCLSPDTLLHCGKERTAKDISTRSHDLQVNGSKRHACCHLDCFAKQPRETAFFAVPAILFLLNCTNLESCMNRGKTRVADWIVSRSALGGCYFRGRGNALLSNRVRETGILCDLQYESLE